MLAGRWQAHGLDRRAGGADLALRVGVQDTPYGSAARALAARAAQARDAPLVWTWRGAPHLHPPAGLPALARALWPVSDADATARIATSSIREGARRGLEAFAAAATAMRVAVTHRLAKGEVSALVSAQVPADLTYDCEPCRARHVSGALFQQVGLAAGVQVVPQGRSTWLEPLPEEVRLPAVPARSEGAGEALRSFVALHVTASTAHLAAFVGTTAGVAKGLLPAGLVPVTGPGGPGWTTPEVLARAPHAPAPRGTRLLPPSDPWLQARDREVVVPDPVRRRAVWRAIGGPGVVLEDGEVVGLWRASAPRAGRLAVAVEVFAPPTARLREEVEAEALLLAAARSGVEVTFTDS